MNTLSRFKTARHKRRQWDALLKEAYHYALPGHVGTSHSDVFDSTAVCALQWKKARLHGTLFPPFKEWMDFTLDTPLNENAYAYLHKMKKNFHAAIDVSNFHIEIDPALADACISTGCLMVTEGSPSCPLRFEAVPVQQLIPEEGPSGMIKTLFREWSLPGRHLLQKWHDAHLPASVHTLLQRDLDQPLSIMEAMLNDPEDDSCVYEVWILEHEPTKILTRLYTTSPALAFRMDKAPGEWMGRGPVLNVLGDIKTANKVVELVLKNASIATTGMWQAEDDGVLNLSNIRLVPGTIIPKAPGSSGLQPLAAPGNFDVSHLILGQLQESIQRGIVGNPLPPMGETTHRTALEIEARLTEHQAVDTPMSLRLLTELASPLAQRILSILCSPSMAGSSYYIPPYPQGQRLLTPIPPFLRWQERDEAEQVHKAYIAATSLFGEMVGEVVDQKGYLHNFLMRSGFPTGYLKGPSS